MSHFQIWLSEMLKVLGGLPLKWVHVILHLTPLCLQLKTFNLFHFFLYIFQPQIPLLLPSEHSLSFRPGHRHGRKTWQRGNCHSHPRGPECEDVRKKHIWPPFELNANVSPPIVLFETVGFSFFFIYSTGSAMPKNFHTLLKSLLELHLIHT